LSGFPNPGIDVFTLGLNVPDDSDVTIHITNTAGRLVRQIEPHNRTRTQGFTINISDLSEGIYFYHIQSANGDILEQGKLIKK